MPNASRFHISEKITLKRGRYTEHTNKCSNSSKQSFIMLQINHPLAGLEKTFPTTTYNTLKEVDL